MGRGQKLGDHPCVFPLPSRAFRLPSPKWDRSCQFSGFSEKLQQWLWLQLWSTGTMKIRASAMKPSSNSVTQVSIIEVRAILKNPIHVIWNTLLSGPQKITRSSFLTRVSFGLLLISGERGSKCLFAYPAYPRPQKATGHLAHGRLRQLAAETNGPVNVNWSTNARNQKQVGHIEYGQLCVYVFFCIIYAYNKPIGIWNWMGNQSIIIGHQWWSMPIYICLFTTVNQNGQTVNHSFFVSTQNQRSHDLGMYWTFRLWGHNESLLLAWIFSPMPTALTWVGQLRPLAPNIANQRWERTGYVSNFPKLRLKLLCSLVYTGRWWFTWWHAMTIQTEK